MMYTMSLWLEESAIFGAKTAMCHFWTVIIDALYLSVFMTTIAGVVQH